MVSERKSFPYEGKLFTYYQHLFSISSLFTALAYTLLLIRQNPEDALVFVYWFLQNMVFHQAAQALVIPISLPNLIYTLFL